MVGAHASYDLSGVSADVIWFCVPDGEIRAAALALSQTPRRFDKLRVGSFAKNARRTGQPEFEWDKFDWKGTVALHSSGALSSDELSVLRERGAAVASVHPLMTFVRGATGRRSSMRESRALAGVPFAIEGDASAVRMARRLVKDLGGIAYAIRKDDKAAYHAWGTFASPLLTALLATTEHVAALAGVNRRAVKQRMLPILRQTLANYAAFGAADGFSGPMVRGDVNTVKRHLKVLRGMPPAREVYVALAGAALEYLPVKNKKSLKRILDSARE
jgi:hypothetical protein